jgi:UDP-2,4-diacetamido-2,4,6-trideoxy-beta-L-altropyranose hydrolase
MPPQTLAQVKVAFRVDAVPARGGGHAYRCVALADALADQSAHCIFATKATTLKTVPALASSGYEIVVLDDRSDEAFEASDMGIRVGRVDVLIVDDYRLGAAFEQTARAWAPFIVAIDDAPNRAHIVDVVIDPTYGRTALAYAGAAPGARVLAGSDYALLRPQFACLREASLAWREQRAGRLERILVCFGAVDPDNYTEAALDILLQIADVHINILVGASHPRTPAIRAKIAEAGARVRLLESRDDVAELMVNSDLTIGAAGGMSWERCALGVPAVAVSIADNQRDVGESVARAGAMLYLGGGLDAMRKALAITVTTLRAEPAQLTEMSRAAASLCDGRGAQRAAAALLRAAGKRCGLATA